MVVLIVRSRVEGEGVGRHELWLEMRSSVLGVLCFVAGVCGSWWTSSDGLSRQRYTFLEGAQTVLTFRVLWMKEMLVDLSERADWDDQDSVTAKADFGQLL